MQQQTIFRLAVALLLSVISILLPRLALAAPPDNDNFTNATVVAVLPYSSFQDTTEATMQTGEPTPTCVANFRGKTVWYAYTPATSGSLATGVGTDSQDFQATLAIYTGLSLDSLTELGCFNRDPYVLSAFFAQAGTTYYFQVSSGYDYSGQIRFFLDFPLPFEADFYYSPLDPSVFDTLSFSDSSWDPYGVGIQSQAWNFGDGAMAVGCCPSHRYAADGDYTVSLAVTTYDGRTASKIRTVTVKTHDVAITKFAAPNAAHAGQTRNLVVDLTSKYYDENVTVQLLKGNPDDPWTQWLPVGALTQFVPVRSSNRTTDFNFSYTFTPADAQTGKVSFKVVATLLTGCDALPTDNEVIAPPTKVGGKASAASSGDPASVKRNMQIFLPVVAKE